MYRSASCQKLTVLGPGAQRAQDVVAGLKHSYTSAEDRHDLGVGPARGEGHAGVHREEGFKASEGCLGAFPEAKGECTPGRWGSRRKAWSGTG